MFEVEARPRTNFLYQDVRFHVGDVVEINTKSGKTYKLPLVEIVGDLAFLEDRSNRIQLNVVTGKILLLK